MTPGKVPRKGLSDLSPQQALRLIKELSPLGAPTLAQLRQAFSRFYEQFRSGPEPLAEEVHVGDLRGYWISAPGAGDEATALFFHGGGFTIGSTRDHLDLCAGLSAACGARLLSIDYRLAPEHPFPAAVNDCAAAYEWLLQRGREPASLSLAGISAGGTLTLTTLLRARDQGLPLPAAAVCMSPVVDLTFPGASMESNRASDWVTSQRLESLQSNYLAGADPGLPLASPTMADLSGLPPLLLQVGGGELMRDDILAFKDKAVGAGVEVEFQLWEEMFHCWQVFRALLPQGREAIKSAGGFLKRHMSA